MTTMLLCMRREKKRIEILPDFLQCVFCWAMCVRVSLPGMVGGRGRWQVSGTIPLSNIFSYAYEPNPSTLYKFIFMNSQYLKKPNLAKTLEHFHNPHFTITTCEMQGWRRTMEDCQLHTQLQKDIHLFALFDGHGGPQISQYASKHLAQQIINEPYFKLKNHHRALANVFRRIDEMILSQRGEKDLLKLNKQMKGGKIKEDEKVGCKAGTTAIVILMTKDRYFTANIGDSRAVLCRSGKAVPLSTDHKPDLPSEHNRIQKAGGFVQKNRVNGTLNLSRAFGDFQYKTNANMGYEQQCVISVPEITEVARSEGDEFIIMGCDGIWQKYVANNQKMVSNLHGLLQKNQPKVAVDKLYSQLVAKNEKQALGFDNMTSILVKFH